MIRKLIWKYGSYFKSFYFSLNFMLKCFDILFDTLGRWKDVLRCFPPNSFLHGYTTELYDVWLNSMVIITPDSDKINLYFKIISLMLYTMKRQSTVTEACFAIIIYSKIFKHDDNKFIEQPSAIMFLNMKQRLSVAVQT